MSAPFISDFKYFLMILSVSDLSGFQNFLCLICASVHIAKFKYDSNTNISNRLSLEQ